MTSRGEATGELASTGEGMPNMPGTETGEAGSTGEPGGSSGGTGEPAPRPGNATDENLLVALVGDQGTGKGTKAVYKLVLDEKADFMILLGDFDYGDNPDGWAAEMNGAIGDSYPVFGVIGNHDAKKWSAYQAKLQERLAKIPGATCTGDLGVQSSCHYRGLHFILSGLGTKGSDASHEQFLADTLAADESLWSVCAWHKNMRDLQAGDKPDEITWKALQACQNNGAIVAMGHEHSYARTRTLTDLGNAAGGHGAVGMPELLEVGAGRTFTVCSGLGGKSIRAYEPSLHDDDTWWATLYTSNYHRRNDAEIKPFTSDYGVLFMRFHVDGDPTHAHGYFKNVQGEVIDEFDVTRK